MPSHFTCTHRLQTAVATPDVEVLNLPQSSHPYGAVERGSAPRGKRWDGQGSAGHASQSHLRRNSNPRRNDALRVRQLIAWNPEPMRLYRDTNYLGHRIHDRLGSWRLEHAIAYANFNVTQAKVTTMDTRLVRRNAPTASVNISGLASGGGKGHASSQLFFVMDKPGQ
eukprot:3602429-Pleurochrysis_carterae.AAC.2